jgi:hypothetical protein
MKIKFLVVVFVGVSLISVQLTLVECSSSSSNKETSDYYSHAGFGLAILQLPFALPFYAVQAFTRNTGNLILSGIRRVIRFNRKPVNKTSSGSSVLTDETLTDASITDKVTATVAVDQLTVSSREFIDER